MDPVNVLVAIFAAIGATWGIYYQRWRCKLLRSYWGRDCQGREWKVTFPMSHADEVRKFLSVFVDCFGFSAATMLKFAPSDTVLAIYRASNPDPSAPDNLELEGLDRELKRAFGQDLTAIWHEEITLGDIFRHVAHAA